MPCGRWMNPPRTGRRRKSVFESARDTFADCVESRSQIATADGRSSIGRAWLLPGPEFLSRTRFEKSEQTFPSMPEVGHSPARQPHSCCFRAPMIAWMARVFEDGSQVFRTREGIKQTTIRREPLKNSPRRRTSVYLIHARRLMM